MPALPERAGPFLPDESSLPPPDRPAWPIEKIRELLSSGKPTSALFAVRQAAARAEPLETAAIVEAVSRLLEVSSNMVVMRSLEALPGLAGHPAAPEVAEAVASRLPSFGEGADEEALEALARLAPWDHVQAFADGLESGSERVEIAALRGIAAGRSEGAPIILLGFLGRTSKASSGAVALAGLVRLRLAGLAERGAEVFLESFADREDVEDAVVDVEDALETAAGLFMRVETSLYPLEDEPSAPEERKTVFLPRDDPAAARRAREIIGPERAARILALADAGEYVELARILGDLALEAIEQASRENPSFEPLGRTLAGIARSVLEWKELPDLEPPARMLAASFLGAVLAKAVRGRDIARDLEEAGEDPEKLLDLCRADEPWVDERTFERLARALGEEDLARLSTCVDREVAGRRSFLLAAADPRRHVKEALEALAPSASEASQLVPGLIRVAGDSILPPLVDALREDENHLTVAILTDALRVLGTERSRACLELWVEDLPGLGVPAAEILEAACAAGSRPAAEAAIALIREGAFDLEGDKVVDPDLYDTEWALQTCLDVLGIRGDARVILAEGWRASGGTIPPSVEEDPFLEDEEDLYEDGEEDEPDDPEPIAPIVRDAPKIGRNDPCPCGSGKKYKKCCGAGP